MQDIFSHVCNHYNDRVEKYGHNFQAMDFGHASSQIVRFEQLVQVANLDSKSILDVGCGFANLYDFITKTGANIDYTGYDISERMIEEAKIDHPNLDLQVRNIMCDKPDKKFDVVFANGIFSAMNDEAWPTVKDVIKTMFELCNEACAFTSLSKWTPPTDYPDFFADPILTIEFCRTLTPWLVFKHHYMPHDFTIFMYRQKQ